MPSGPLAHICMLVDDLDAAVDKWTKILTVLDPGQLERKLVRYEDFDGGGDRVRWATFVSDHGAEIQLMEPDPESHLGRRLAKYGEHVHHVCFTTDDVDDTARRLRESGIEMTDGINENPNMDWQRWTWILPPSAAGVLVEIARPYKDVDGLWESAAAE